MTQTQRNSTWWSRGQEGEATGTHLGTRATSAGWAYTPTGTSQYKYTTTYNPGDSTTGITWTHSRFGLKEPCTQIKGVIFW